METKVHQFKNILYVSDKPNDETEGLKQALSLARNNDASLKILIICPELPSKFDEYQKKMEADLTTQMAATISSTMQIIKMEKSNLSITIETLIDKTPAVAIIQDVLKNGHDLVIKEPELKSLQDGYKAIDMSLSRKCPVPVWLCKPITCSRDKIRVAVAIDPNIREPEEDNLSCLLLEVSRNLTDFCNGELNIISCWDFTLEKELKENVFIKTDAEHIKTLVEEEKINHYSKLEKLIDRSKIQGKNLVHHLRGKPEDIIPKFVDENEINILVMGTVARTGIPGFITGNTAENIMQNISCSLLALKPRGFVSPVKAF